MHIKKLAWLGTRTENDSSTAAFFGDVLGLSESYREAGFWVFALPDGSKVEVFGPSTDYNRHFTTGPVAGFLVDDVQEAARELDQRAIEIVSGPTSSPDGNAWVHFRAPDGNIYEFTQDPGVNRSDVEATPHFGWQDMFVAPEDDPRSEAPSVGERATLVNYLHFYRQTLELKCSGLDASAMARRSVPPSKMSLLGLVRHLADVERYWFRQVLAGEDARYVFRTEDDRDAAFNGALPDHEVVNKAWIAWRAEVTFAERFVEEATSLDATGRLGSSATQQEISLREVLVHMIDEYARHCGHADLLRERIDGRVGQ